MWCACVLQGVGEPVNGTQGRKSSSVGLQNSNQCRQSLPLGPNVNWTFTADGRLESGSGVCLSVEKTPGPQLWSKPLSDSKLTRLLDEKGINVARRTVAKYREALRIPPSNERKELA